MQVFVYPESLTSKMHYAADPQRTQPITSHNWTPNMDTCSVGQQKLKQQSAVFNFNHKTSATKQ